MKRVSIVGITIAALIAVAGARSRLRERRRRVAFPASQAQALLNPLRRAIQPRGRTVRSFALQPGDVVPEWGLGPGTSRRKQRSRFCPSAG